MVLWVDWAQPGQSHLGSLTQLYSDVTWGWIHLKAEHARWRTHVLGNGHSYWPGSSAEMLAGLPICSLCIYLGLLTAIALLDY